MVLAGRLSLSRRLLWGDSTQERAELLKENLFRAVHLNHRLSPTAGRVGLGIEEEVVRAGVDIGVVLLGKQEGKLEGELEVRLGVRWWSWSVAMWGCGLS